MLHVTCDLAGVHTPTEWLLHCEEVPVLLLTVVTTYATHQHQALLGKQQGRRDSQRRVKKITLVSWTEARIIFYLFCPLSCVWIYSGPGFSFEGMDVGSSSVHAVGSV